jgi:dolichol-phosphate mannosyltransferase
MKKISICIPVLNEEKNIINIYKKIKDIFEKDLNDYQNEFIFTDNNSDDRTQEIITDLCKKDKNVKYIRFKKNINYDNSILEGYIHANGDAAIVIDCDLQDPPEMFGKFINEWENGYDLVYGKVKSRNESFIISSLRKLYYKLINLNSYYNYPENAHDFRLIDKSIIEKLKNIDYIFPYVRGITFNFSKNPIGIIYDRNERSKGKSKFGFYKSVTYSANAFYEETFLFTKIFRRLTLFITTIFILFSTINIFTNFAYLKFFDNLILSILILLAIFLTVITEYLTRIYLQLKKIKTNIYEFKINF